MMEEVRRMVRHDFYMKYDKERGDDRPWCLACKKFLEWEDEEHFYPIPDDAEIVH